MKLGEKIKSLYQPKRKKIGQRFFTGNRVYYVDAFRRPHTGEVFMVNKKDRTVYLTNVSNVMSIPEVEGKPTIDIVSMDCCVKTDEIYLGEPNSYDKIVRRYYDEKDALELIYENMPKKVIDPNKANSFQPLLLMKEGYYLEIEKYPGLWLIVATHSGLNMEPCYMLINERGERKIPALYFEKCYGHEGMYVQSFSDINQLMENMYHPSEYIYIDDVLKVYTPDPNSTDAMRYDPNHMTIAYKKPKESLQR